MGKKSRRKKQEKTPPGGSLTPEEVRAALSGGGLPGGLSAAESLQRQQNFLRDRFAQRDRADTTQAHQSENDTLIVKIRNWGNRGLDEQQQLIRKVFTNCGIDWKSYDDYSDGDQSKLVGKKVRNDLRRLWMTGFDFGLCSHAAEAQTTMMRDEPNLDMAEAMMQALGINGSGEEFNEQAKKFTERVETMEKGFNHLSRLGSYAERALPKQVEELIMKKTKPGTNDRKRLLEKRDTTFRFTPLMSTFYSILNANEYALTDGFESVVQVLLKYGANPFARDIIGRTVIHLATNFKNPKGRTPRVLKMAQMCIDASRHYDKVHQHVTLQALSKADLNGREGYCSGFDANTGRLVVYLTNGDGSLQLKPLAIKPENVQLSTTVGGANSFKASTPLVDYETRISTTPLFWIVMDGTRDDLASFLIANGADLDIGHDTITPRNLATNSVLNIGMATFQDDMKDRPVLSVIRKEIARQEKKAFKSQGDKSDKESCASCGKTNKDLHHCINCYGVLYCNRECQKAHWKLHKKECKSSAALPLGPPMGAELNPEMVSQSIQFVEGLDLDSSSFGTYRSPDMVAPGDTFWVKISAFGKVFLLCQDETRTCCFIIYNDSETFDAVFQFNHA